VGFSLSLEITMSTTQKPASTHPHERKPTSPQHDDHKQHPGQPKPTTPEREDHRDRNAPPKK
jgi:hypothetical protein